MGPADVIVGCLTLLVRGIRARRRKWILANSPTVGDSALIYSTIYSMTSSFGIPNLHNIQNTDQSKHANKPTKETISHKNASNRSSDLVTRDFPFNFNTNGSKKTFRYYASFPTIFRNIKTLLFGTLKPDMWRKTANNIVQSPSVVSSKKIIQNSVSKCDDSMM